MNDQVTAEEKELIETMEIVDQMLDEDAKAGIRFYIQAYFPDIPFGEIRRGVDGAFDVIFDVVRVASSHCDGPIQQAPHAQPRTSLSTDVAVEVARFVLVEESATDGE